MSEIYFKNNWGAFRARFDADKNLVHLIKTNKHSRKLVAHELGNILESFFNQEQFSLPNIRLHGTEFQLKVWNAIAKIPLGKTMTYKEIAQIINHPKALRAVGTACKMNPIAFLIPCHRVISSTNGIGNYYYGEKLKRLLLTKEANFGR